MYNVALLLGAAVVDFLRGLRKQRIDLDTFAFYSMFMLMMAWLSGS